jgi:hypothetical protein
LQALNRQSGEGAAPEDQPANSIIFTPFYGSRSPVLESPIFGVD